MLTEVACLHTNFVEPLFGYVTVFVRGSFYVPLYFHPDMKVAFERTDP